MTDGSDETARRVFERALHESTAIADRIREAIANAPHKLVMPAMRDVMLGRSIYRREVTLNLLWHSFKREGDNEYEGHQELLVCCHPGLTAMTMKLTEQQARVLASMDRHWVAREMLGGWVVWSEESDHVVEFDGDAAEKWLKYLKQKKALGE
jgi:hypothetical protein